jgi:DNA repair exonuclease SbcCD nuclease subunit
MVKVLATADWQLDMRAHKLSERATSKLFQARLDALENLLSLAEEHKVDCILAAGDLFEVPNPRASLITDVARLLHSNSSIEIHVIPGNHDLCGPGSVWSKPEMTAIPHLHVHENYSPVELESFVLHPIPVHNIHELDHYDELLSDVKSDDRIHIVMAHAHDVSYMDFRTSDHEVGAKLPIDTSELKNKGYDLCVLGHWHSWTQVQDNALYPGTHEQTKFGEKDAGNVALITVNKGQTPIFEKLQTGQLRWQTKSIAVDDLNEEDIIQHLHELKNEGCDFLQVTMTGEANIDFITDSIPRIKQASDPMFDYIEIDSSGIKKHIDVKQLQRRHALPILLEKIQSDILQELNAAVDEDEQERLLAELEEFWRSLRDTGLLGGGT